MNTPHVLIIGGGITGLSAAWYLQQQGLSYTVVERAARWGGKVQSEQVHAAGTRPFMLETGPESFVTRKPEVYNLARDMGILDQVESASNEARGIYILTNGEALPLPLAPPAFIRSPIMSLRGKLRLLAEPFIPARRDMEDESIADFASRRLGPEAHERLIGPILGGIYNTDPAQQSIMTTSPIMREMEAEYGGLVVALIRKLLAARKHKSDQPKPPRFISFKGGAEGLINALVDNLTGTLRLNAEVVCLEETAQGRYAAQLADGEMLKADAVILTSPANVSAGLIGNLAPDAARLMADIEHVNIGTATLMYHAQDFPESIRHMSGLMIPRREKRRIDAVTFTSHKTPEFAPEGYELIKVFFGGGAPELVTQPEAQALQAIQDELRDLLGIEAAPLDYRLYRWPDSYAQARVGHPDDVTQIENALPQGIFVAGASYRGLAVPDCVKQAQTTAQAVAKSLA
ncbi:MAG: protoporphyrinogen oxidase [Anaerolineales bacterium]